MADVFLPGSAREIPRRLVRCLNDNAVRYRTQHEPEGPEQIRQSLNHQGLVHAAVIRAGKRRLLAVLPSGQDIDLKKFAKLIGAPARLETEDEFKWLFPDCALGAIPPFGNLYGLATWVEKSVTGKEHITFLAGTLIDTITLAYSTYQELEQPSIGTFSSKSSISPNILSQRRRDAKVRPQT